MNVRLQHISDDTIISVGNIAYHFKNKEAIISSIFEEVDRQLQDALIEYRHTPIFENVDRIFSNFDTLQAHYSFFFTDIIEIKRAYPELFERISRFWEWQIMMFQEVFRFNIARGAFRKIMDETDIDFMARLIVGHIHSWKSLQLTEENHKNRGEARLSGYIWRILWPYMTESGMEEYRVMTERNVRVHRKTNPL